MNGGPADPTVQAPAHAGPDRTIKKAEACVIWARSAPVADCAGRCATFGRGTVSVRVTVGHRVVSTTRIS